MSEVHARVEEKKIDEGAPMAAVELRPGQIPARPPEGEGRSRAFLGAAAAILLCIVLALAFL